MAHTLDDIVQHLDAKLLPSRYDDPTGNGLLVRGRSPIRRVGAALNTSFAAIDEAIQTDCGLLFVHHAPWASIELDLYQAKLERLRSAGVSLYAAHEALDRAANNSVGAILARLVDVTIEREGDADLVIGHAPPLTFENWTALVARRLDTPVRAWSNNRQFARVGIVPGGGGGTAYLAAALALGCDTFLTGEGSLYTELFAREHELSLVFASHGATEFPAVTAFVAALAEELGLEWRAIREAEHIAGGGRAPIQHTPRGAI